MDMNSGSNTNNGSMMVMMTPFFHFIGGDYLLFQSWKPTSGGAIAGACIGLFFFALFERYIHAISPLIEDYLRQRALRRMSPTDTPSSRRSSSDASETPSVVKKPNFPIARTIPPFIAAADIPRGALYAFQRLLGFALMLAVMTYQAGYIISIVVGLGLGEILFGRMATSLVESCN